jgi:hypothetical protein
VFVGVYGVENTSEDDAIMYTGGSVVHLQSSLAFTGQMRGRTVH